MSEGFVHPVAVRYLEVDGQGVVFNMWYLAYFDDALTGFFAHNGVAYADLMAQGYDVQLVHAEVDWRGAAGWPDELGIAVRLLRRGTTSFALGYRALKHGETICDAEIVYVCVATDGTGKRPLPDLLLRGLGA